MLPVLSILGKNRAKESTSVVAQASGAKFAKWELIAGFSAKEQSPQENPMLYSSIRVDIMQQLLIQYASGDERL